MRHTRCVRTTEAFVVAPAVGLRVSRWTGDQADYDAATAHLDATLRARLEDDALARARDRYDVPVTPIIV